MQLLYMVTVFLIRCYKRVEYGILRLIGPLILPIVIKKLDQVGITINKGGPCDIKNRNFMTSQDTVYIRAINEGILGFGESYMDGDWDAEDIPAVFYKIFANDAPILRMFMNPWNRFLYYMQFSFFNLQTKQRVYDVAKIHYDLGNEFFENMLDSTMNYTCGYFKDTDNLEKAQLAKMDFVAAKLGIKQGMTVLDIGCGFGGMARHLAINYGATVTAVTISKEQATFAQQACRGLPVTVKVMDYRDVSGTYDRVVSLGDLEHIGPANYGTFFKTVSRCLKEDGLCLIHCMGNYHDVMPHQEPFSAKYVFPGACLPYYTEVMGSLQNLFLIEDWHNFGNDYNLTSVAWRDNFIRNWPKLQQLDKIKYDDRFYRMWTFYLGVAIALYKARKIQLWQIVLSKHGVVGGYRSVR
ncbi:cyclopropane-fatty-acyl-phospholipid synthase [Folsomia candida]|nr:cyclopropane-fatty-acyl-phospholipid synthase [Folsomia candida]